jgi:hypothetical protein
MWIGLLPASAIRLPEQCSLSLHGGEQNGLLFANESDVLFLEPVIVFRKQYPLLGIGAWPAYTSFLVFPRVDSGTATERGRRSGGHVVPRGLVGAHYK